MVDSIYVSRYYPPFQKSVKGEIKMEQPISENVKKLFESLKAFDKIENHSIVLAMTGLNLDDTFTLVESLANKNGLVGITSGSASMLLEMFILGAVAHANFLKKELQ